MSNLVANESMRAYLVGPFCFAFCSAYIRGRIMGALMVTGAHWLESRRTRSGGKHWPHFDCVTPDHPLTCRDLSKLEEEITRKRVSMDHKCLNNLIAATIRVYCIRRTLPTRFDASFRALALVKNFQGSTRRMACPWRMTQSSQPRAKRKKRRSRTASSKALESSLRRLCVVLKCLEVS